MTSQPSSVFTAVSPTARTSHDATPSPTAQHHNHVTQPSQTSYTHGTSRHAPSKVTQITLILSPCIKLDGDRLGLGSTQTWNHARVAGNISKNIYIFKWLGKICCTRKYPSQSICHPGTSHRTCRTRSMKMELLDCRSRA